jgi:hypothetical protein
MLLGESMYDEWFNKQEDGMSTEPIREIPKFDGMPKLEFAKSFASLFSKGNTQSNNDGSSDKSLDESFWFTDEESANLSSWK